MNANLRSRLSMTILVTAIWLTAGAAAARETMMDSGMMEDGRWYGFGGIWLTMLAIGVVGVVLFAVLRRR